MTLTAGATEMQQNGEKTTTSSRLPTGFAKPMSEAEFHRLSEFIRAECGIKMPHAKKIMLEARLQKRLRTLGMATFRDYCERLFNSPDGSSELEQMINAVTTNKTDFFREPVHFQYLTETVLPEFFEGRELGGGRRFTVWSAGCSSGEEPYTLAMALSDFREQHPAFQFSILATDISTKVLDKARAGIYDMERVETVPYQFKQRYLLRSKDRHANLVRIAPELRTSVAFQRLNLMDEQPITADPINTIFCRNVIIYFERDTQYALLSRLCRVLATGGYLFLGHSETVHGFDLPLARVASTIYRKTE